MIHEQRLPRSRANWARSDKPIYIYIYIFIGITYRYITYMYKT